MSATELEQVAIDQRRVAAFLKMKRCSDLQVVASNDMLWLHTPYTGHNTASSHPNSSDVAIAVGECDDGVYLKVNRSGVAKHIRASKAGSELRFDLARTDSGHRELHVDSDRLGSREFSGENTASGWEPLGRLGEHRFSIGYEDVCLAASITSRADPECTRYALGCVAFDGNNIVATDGRRMSVIESSTWFTDLYEPVLIPADVINYARSFCTGIEVYDRRIVAGDLVSGIPGGRFPQWRQVRMDDAKLDGCHTVPAAELRRAADRQIDLSKAREDEESGMLIQLAEGESVLLDARFVKDAIKGLDTIEIHYNCEKVGKSVVCIKSPEDERYAEWIMPMACRK